MSAVLEAANLTAQLYKLDAAGKPFEAGDRVFGFFEESFEGGEQEFADCDLVLQSLETDRLSDTVLVAVLAVTLPARDRLPSRLNFLNRVRESIARTKPDEAKFIAESYK